VKDADSSDKITVYYQIDNGKAVEIDSYTSKGKTATIDGELPANLSVGEHTVIFYAEDKSGNCSNDDGDTKVKDLEEDEGNKITITVTNSAPVLKILSVPSTADSAATVPVSLSVEENDAGQTVTVYYQIDDKFPEKAASFTSTGSAYTVNFEIPALTEGSHTITFYAEDEAGLRSNKNGNVSTQTYYTATTNQDVNQVTVTVQDSSKTGKSEFTNVPTVDIITSPENVKSGDNYKVTFSVLDKDKGESVSIYYSLDGGEAKEYLTYSSNGIANVKTINLGKLDSTVSHKVAVWAIDASGNRSDADISISSIGDNENTIQTTENTSTTFTTSVKTGVESANTSRSIMAAIVGLGAVSAAGISAFKNKKNK
jgi:hypothetical protein